MSEQTFSAASQTWTINYVINTQKLMEFAANTSSWGSPMGKSWTKEWLENSAVIITSSNPNCVPRLINNYSFELKVAPRDQIQWVVTDMNPLGNNHCTVGMYGFSTSDNWDKILTPPSSPVRNMDLMAITPAAFNGSNKPQGNDWLDLKSSTISAPSTQVKGDAKGSVSYNVKIVLVDIDGSVNTAKNFFQIDPTITVI